MEHRKRQATVHMAALTGKRQMAELFHPASAILPHQEKSGE